MDEQERLPHSGQTREEIAQRARASRVAQGLPERITDRSTLARIARLLTHS